MPAWSPLRSLPLFASLLVGCVGPGSEEPGSEEPVEDVTPSDLPLGALFCVDSDGDGATPCDGDCDDRDAAIGPHATDGLDGRDTDCDGSADEDALEALPAPGRLEVVGSVGASLVDVAVGGGELWVAWYTGGEGSLYAARWNGAAWDYTNAMQTWMLPGWIQLTVDADGAPKAFLSNENGVLMRANWDGEGWPCDDMDLEAGGAIRPFVLEREDGYLIGYRSSAGAVRVWEGPSVGGVWTELSDVPGDSMVHAADFGEGALSWIEDGELVVAIKDGDWQIEGTGIAAVPSGLCLADPCPTAGAHALIAGDDLGIAIGGQVAWRTEGWQLSGAAGDEGLASSRERWFLDAGGVLRHRSVDGGELLRRHWVDGLVDSERLPLFEDVPVTQVNYAAGAWVGRTADGEVWAAF